MKSVLYRYFLWPLAGLLLTLLIAAGLALQTAPRLPPVPAPSALDVARARDFLRRNDPRQTPPGTLGRLQASEAELAVLLNYAVSRYPALQASLRLALRQDQAELLASAPLGGPFWLNLQARLLPEAGLPRIEGLRIGRLPLPDWLVALARDWLLVRLADGDQMRLAREMVRQVSVQPGHLQLIYEWRADSYRRMLDSLLPAAEQARLRAYSDRLVALSARYEGVVPMIELLPPLFALAQQRSAAGEDAAAENRAALLTLAAHSTGRGLGALLPAARAWPQPRPLAFVLHGRVDFPQHLLVSAALAAEAGGPLADAIGIYKEVADTRGGSGFSFNDIAADRAGSRLGQLAVNQPERLQQRLATGLRELELLPDISDLPEFLSAAEFQRHYGGLEAPAYRAMLAKIEARLNGMPLLR